jgi:tRNA-2-methylthio-N6-dimethylallyladenosine synthase
MKNFNYPRKVFVKTYGCQMNVYDSDKIKNLLRKQGFVQTDDPLDADMIVLNTCHIREKASEKIYSELGKINKNAKKRKEKLGLDTITVVAGCVAQAEGEVIFSRAPNVDIVVGPQSYQNLPALIAEVTANNGQQINLEFEVDKKFDYLKEEDKTQGYSAFVTIQEGCDKFCKFCCVPYTRGPEFSRMPSDLFRESLNLSKLGTKEITLLGQNVNGYRSLGLDKKEFDIADLIRMIATIPNIDRIRYTTSHPNDVNDNLILVHKEEMKLMPYLHLPVQSGSDKILKEMNRKHTSKHYLEIIDKFRKARPDIAFSSDFIIGYPGETDQDFQDTVNLVKEVNYAQCYSFKYSPRPGTPAAESKDQVPEEVKTERLAILQDILYQQQKTFNDSFVGKEVEVLLEKKGRKDNQAVGKSEYLQSVHINDADHLIGKIIKAKVIESKTNSLFAELI